MDGADGTEFQPRALTFRPIRPRAALPRVQIVNGPPFAEATRARWTAGPGVSGPAGTSMHEHRIRHVPLDLIDDEQPRRLGPGI
jgi:hypothetical protein